MKESLIEKLRLPFISYRKIPLEGFLEDISEVSTNGVTMLFIETSGYVEKIYVYVVPGLS